MSIVGYAIQAAAPPFPVFVAAMGFVGFSMTLQDIHANGYVANMRKSSSMLGLLHCLYGERIKASIVGKLAQAEYCLLRQVLARSLHRLLRPSLRSSPVGRSSISSHLVLLPLTSSLRQLSFASVLSKVLFLINLVPNAERE